MTDPKPLTLDEIEAIQVTSDNYRHGLELHEQELQSSLQGIGLTLMVNTFASNTDRLVADLKRAREALKKIAGAPIHPGLTPEENIEELKGFAKKGLGQ